MPKLSLLPYNRFIKRWHGCCYHEYSWHPYKWRKGVYVTIYCRRTGKYYR